MGDENERNARSYLALVAGLEAEAPNGPWKAAFAVERYVRHDEGSAPRVGETSVDRAGARLCESWVRWIAAGLRRDDARRVALAAERVKHVDARAELVAQLAKAWACWLTGDPAPDVVALHKRGASLRFPSLTIEAMSLAALMELEKGDFEGALRRARRASRMGRAEGIPYAEILANVVLARVRRLQGRPHLALRILSALRRYAPAVWTAWIDWEALLAGQWSDDPAPLPELLRSARDGDRTRSDALAKTLREAAAPHAFQRDARLAVELFEGHTGKALGPWQRGEEHALPPALQGLAFASEESSTSELHAWIAVSPDSAMRVAHVASPLAEAAGYVVANGRRHPRADAALALLALAPEAMAKADYFETLYGFAYDPALHGAMLSMHLGRLGKRLGERGQLILGDRIRVEWNTRALIPDPRCAELLPQRALRVLAEHTQGLGARDLAERLAVPLRTAQRALRELVEDGSLLSESRGRGVMYRVEDTTFSEPTMNRVAPLS